MDRTFDSQSSNFQNSMSFASWEKVWEVTWFYLKCKTHGIFTNKHFCACHKLHISRHITKVFLHPRNEDLIYDLSCVLENMFQNVPNFYLRDQPRNSEKLNRFVAEWQVCDRNCHVAAHEETISSTCRARRVSRLFLPKLWISINVNDSKSDICRTVLTGWPRSTSCSSSPLWMEVQMAFKSKKKTPNKWFLLILFYSF